MRREKLDIIRNNYLSTDEEKVLEDSYKIHQEILNGADSNFLKKEVTFDENITCGIFKEIIDNVLFECFFHDGGNENLYVVYNGMRPTAEINHKPYFARWSYYDLVEGSYLGIDDPMFHQYSKLLLGWYWGEPKRSYIIDSIQIIDRICEYKRIDTKKIIFMSSSGGGYAGLFAAATIPGTFAIAINPQLYIQDYYHANEFKEITGIDLSSDDSLLRNNLAEKIKKNTESKYMIIINCRSSFDWKTQMNPFLEEFSMDLNYGLTIMNNILIWTYDAEGAPSPHTSFETKPIFMAIDYIAKAYRSGDYNFSQLNQIALLVNEYWHDLYNLKSRILQNVDKVLAIKSLPEYKLIASFSSKKVIAGLNNYAYFKYSFPRPGSIYQIIYNCSVNDSEEYTVGIYNAVTKARDFYKEYEKDEEHTFSVVVKKDHPAINLCIYAGVFGNTANNTLTINSLIIFESENAILI